MITTLGMGSEFFPFSFVERPYICPGAVKELSLPWPSYGENGIASVEIWNSGPGRRSLSESRSLDLGSEGSFPISFEYYYRGKTDNGIIVLETHEMTGGSGCFIGLLFVVLERETYLIHSERRERVLLKRVGSHFLGDHWVGGMEIQGSQVQVSTVQTGCRAIYRDEVQSTDLLDLSDLNVPKKIDRDFIHCVVEEQPITSFLHATLCHDSLELEALLEKKPSLDILNDPTHSLLLETLRHGWNEENAVLLLKYGVDQTGEDQNGNTALHLAATQGWIEVAQILVKQGLDMNQRNHQGRTPLFEARSEEMVRYLIANGARADLIDQEGRTLFSDRIFFSENKQFFEFLFDQGVVAEGEVLLKAADLGSVKVIEAMLDQGVDVDFADILGGTALLTAIRWGKQDVVKLLIERGADLNGKSSKVTPLYQSIDSHWKEGFEILLESGVDVNAKNQGVGETALHRAASQGSLEFVSELVRRGATVDARALSLALQYGGNKDVAVFLIEHGALDAW